MRIPGVKRVTMSLGAVLVAPALVSAGLLYSQNFEPPVPTSSTSAGPSGFLQINNISNTGWQVQGGGGGSGIAVTTGVDTNGVAGSQALFVNNDHSGASSFTFNQYTIYGGVAPAGVPASNVLVDMDLFMSGSESQNDPIEVLIQNNGNDLSFRPTLSNGVYTHVSYLLSQATNAGLFDPAASSNLRLQHGAGGFGFDANNIVRVDNIVIQTIPEPATVPLLGSLLGCISGARRIRRR